MIAAGDAGVSHPCPHGTVQGGSGRTGYPNSRDGGGCVGAGRPKHPPSSVVGWLGRDPHIINPPGWSASKQSGWKGRARGFAAAN